MSQARQKGQFFGIVITEGVMLDTNLSISEKFVYSYISSYVKYCVDSNAKIASRLGVSIPTVTRALAVLSSKGYISVKYTNNCNGKRRIYNILRKSQKVSFLQGKIKHIDKGERYSFPQSFSQLLHNYKLSNQND